MPQKSSKSTDQVVIFCSLGAQLAQILSSGLDVKQPSTPAWHSNTQPHPPDTPTRPRRGIKKMHLKGTKALLGFAEKRIIIIPNGCNIDQRLCFPTKPIHIHWFRMIGLMGFNLHIEWLSIFSWGVFFVFHLKVNVIEVLSRRNIPSTRDVYLGSFFWT